MAVQLDYIDLDLIMEKHWGGFILPATRDKFLDSLMHKNIITDKGRDSLGDMSYTFHADYSDEKSVEAALSSAWRTFQREVPQKADTATISSTPPTLSYEDSRLQSTNGAYPPSPYTPSSHVENAHSSAAMVELQQWEVQSQSAYGVPHNHRQPTFNSEYVAPATSSPYMTSAYVDNGNHSTTAVRPQQWEAQSQSAFPPTGVQGQPTFTSGYVAPAITNTPSWGVSPSPESQQVLHHPNSFSSVASSSSTLSLASTNTSVNISRPSSPPAPPSPPEFVPQSQPPSSNAAQQRPKISSDLEAIKSNIVSALREQGIVGTIPVTDSDIRQEIAHVQKRVGERFKRIKDQIDVASIGSMCAHVTNVLKALANKPGGPKDDQERNFLKEAFLEKALSHEEYLITANNRARSIGLAWAASDSSGKLDIAVGAATELMNGFSPNFESKRTSVRNRLDIKLRNNGSFMDSLIHGINMDNVFQAAKRRIGISSPVTLDESNANYPRPAPSNISNTVNTNHHNVSWNNNHYQSNLSAGAQGSQDRTGRASPEIVQGQSATWQYKPYRPPSLSQFNVNASFQTGTAQPVPSANHRAEQTVPYASSDMRGQTRTSEVSSPPIHDEHEDRHSLYDPSYIPFQKTARPSSQRDTASQRNEIIPSVTLALSFETKQNAIQVYNTYLAGKVKASSGDGFAPKWPKGKDFKVIDSLESLHSSHAKVISLGVDAKTNVASFFVKVVGQENDGRSLKSADGVVLKMHVSEVNKDPVLKANTEFGKEIEFTRDHQSHKFIAKAGSQNTNKSAELQRTNSAKR